MIFGFFMFFECNTIYSEVVLIALESGLKYLAHFARDCYVALHV